MQYQDWRRSKTNLLFHCITCLPYRIKRVTQGYQKLLIGKCEKCGKVQLKKSLLFTKEAPNDLRIGLRHLNMPYKMLHNLLSACLSSLIPDCSPGLPPLPCLHICACTHTARPIKLLPSCHFQTTIWNE